MIPFDYPNRAKRLICLLAGTALALLIAAGLASCTAPSLPEEDVIGIWSTTESNGTSVSDMNEKGIYVLYGFDEDGTFTMTALAQDQSLERKGTWEIDGDKVLVNVPAAGNATAENEEAIISLSADAIENAEITIEDGKLVTNDIGDRTVTAERIDDARYQEILDHAASFAPQKISIGEQVAGNACTFAIDSLSYQDTILPSNTSGYYTYYDDQPNSTYLVARFNYTNTASDYAVIGYATSAVFEVGGNRYEASIELDNGTLFGKSYRLEAQQSGTGIIYASIPDSVKDSPDVTLTWSIPNDAQYMQTFYQNSFDSTDYQLTM